MIRGSILSEDTIFALATPHGCSAIAVIKVSGSNCIEYVSKCFRPQKRFAQPEDANPYSIQYGWWIDPENSDIIDEVLISIFKAPHSFTGEDIIEISCHGSMFIAQEIMRTLGCCGARLAEAGEFTRRAFVAGKMDLSQAEAIADLISARTKASSTMALKQMRGEFKNIIEDVRERLLHFSALMELELDFSEEDVEFAKRDELKNDCKNILSILNKLAESYHTGAILKNGVPTAIVGATNAGKSSLLNALVKEEKAIVTDIHGTTRDSIEDVLILDGIEFRLIDTAGIRETTDKVESIGIRRSFDVIAKANIILYLIDVVKPIGELQNELTHILAQVQSPDKELIVVLNKRDLIKEEKIREVCEILKKSWPSLNIMCISTKINDDIARIETQLVSAYRKQYGERESDGVMVYNFRHYQSLSRAIKELERVEDDLIKEIPNDLIAMDLREVLNELGEITGEISSSDVLHHVFKHFCIGK